MNDEKISYRLIYLLLSAFIMGASLEYAYMDQLIQQNSVAMFAYKCDVRFGQGNWQTERVSYNTWLCVEKLAPEPKLYIKVNTSDEQAGVCLLEGKCNFTKPAP